MSRDKDFSWLKVVGVNETRLLDPGRMSQLATKLRAPANQCPLLVLFLGLRAKDAALEELFPHIESGSETCADLATLQVDKESAGSEYPIYLAQSSPGQNLSRATDDTRCFGTESFSLQWMDTATRTNLYNFVHARILCLFIDVLFVFADDLASFEEAVQLLASWAAIGDNGPTYFKKARPRVVIVTSHAEHGPSSTLDILDIEDIQQGLHNKSLRDFFSTIKVLYLTVEQKSPMARFRRLKGLLRRELDEMLVVRRDLGCLYSAVHLGSFFRLAVGHIVATPNQPFDFVLASRRDNKVQADLEQHLSRFLQLGLKNNAVQESLVIMIASTIILDAYPPKMHVFDSDVVYETLYRQSILRSIVTIYSDQDIVRQLDLCVRHHITRLSLDMIESGNSAMQSHRETLACLELDWSLLKSNKTCLCCLRRAPENILSCGHAMCDICVRNVGEETLTLDDQYHIDACLLCRKGRMVAGLKPLTAGLRVLSVDGGGTRGVIAIGILNLLQGILGNVWRIQDSFDVAYGTSVGGLIVLITFSRQMSTSDCAAIFETLAKQLFPQPTTRVSTFKRFRNLLTAWYRDGCHKAHTLEASLKENLSASDRLFGYARTLTSTKIGITAATIDKGFPLVMTNYNGQVRNNEDCGYKLIRPEDDAEELYVWQAGRATSAAPVLFPVAYTPATGPVQDGGMSGHNNPIKLALWETSRIEPSLSKPDVLVSVGTGTRKVSISPRFTSFRHVLFDGCIPRLWRAYMSSFDGESNFRDVVNHLDNSSRDNYIRLNVLLPADEPGIDNTNRMAELRRSVDENHELVERCHRTVYALLVAAFYFELRTAPKKVSGGRLQCLGTIRCRLPGETIVELLQRVHPSPLAFITSTKTLGRLEGRRDLCSLCRRFRKHVEFTVRDLDQIQDIQVQSFEKARRKISAFPQSMQWFVDRQGLDAPFGTAYHGDLARKSCRLCAGKKKDTLKRVASEPKDKAQPRKKARQCSKP